jgi:hypothetical protein
MTFSPCQPGRELKSAAAQRYPTGGRPGAVLLPPGSRVPVPQSLIANRQSSILNRQRRLTNAENGVEAYCPEDKQRVQSGLRLSLRLWGFLAGKYRGSPMPPAKARTMTRPERSRRYLDILKDFRGPEPLKQGRRGTPRGYPDVGDADNTGQARGLPLRCDGGMAACRAPTRVAPTVPT